MLYEGVHSVLKPGPRSFPYRLQHTIQASGQPPSPGARHDKGRPGGRPGNQKSRRRETGARDPLAAAFRRPILRLTCRRPAAQTTPPMLLQPGPENPYERLPGELRPVLDRLDELVDRPASAVGAARSAARAAGRVGGTLPAVVASGPVSAGGARHPALPVAVLRPCPILVLKISGEGSEELENSGIHPLLKAPVTG